MPHVHHSADGSGRSKSALANDDGASSGVSVSNTVISLRAFLGKWPQVGPNTFAALADAEPSKRRIDHADCHSNATSL